MDLNEFLSLPIETLQALRHLDFSNLTLNSKRLFLASITSEQMTALCNKIRQCKNLRSINLRDNKLARFGAFGNLEMTFLTQFLEALSYCTRLKSIDLSKNYISIFGVNKSVIELFSYLGNFPRLEKVSIAENAISSLSTELITYIFKTFPKIPFLQDLNLSTIGLGNLSGRNLQFLGIGVSLQVVFDNLLHCINLHSLNLADNSLSNIDWQLEATDTHRLNHFLILLSRRLHSLNLKGNNINPERTRMLVRRSPTLFQVESDFQVSRYPYCEDYSDLLMSNSRHAMARDTYSLLFIVHEAISNIIPKDIHSSILDYVAPNPTELDYNLPEGMEVFQQVGVKQGRELFYLKHTIKTPQYKAVVKHSLNQEEDIDLKLKQLELTSEQQDNFPHYSSKPRKMPRRFSQSEPEGIELVDLRTLKSRRKANSF